jgi:hypothetical protein
MSRIAIIPNVVDGGVYQIREPSMIHGPHEVQRVTSGCREDEGETIKRAGVKQWRLTAAVNQPTVAKCAGVKLLMVQGNRGVLECFVHVLHQAPVHCSAESTCPLRGARLVVPWDEKAMRWRSTCSDDGQAKVYRFQEHRITTGPGVTEAALEPRELPVES